MYTVIVISKYSQPFHNTISAYRVVWKPFEWNEIFSSSLVKFISFFTSYKSVFLFSFTNAFDVVVTSINSISSSSSKVSSLSTTSLYILMVYLKFCNLEWNCRIILYCLNHLRWKRFPTCIKRWWFNFRLSWWHCSNTI